MTGEKSETCLLSVNEGDVKLILINVERRGESEQGPMAQASYVSCVKVMFGSSRKYSNADRVNICWAFSSPESIFLSAYPAHSCSGTTGKHIYTTHNQILHLYMKIKKEERKQIKYSMLLG